MIAKSFEYKKVDNCSIKLDVYEANIEDNFNRKNKIIVYIHGGGFILGSRKDISKKQIELYTNAGYTLVSIDYRLAPITNLTDIIDDINDAMIWVRYELEKHFNVDCKSIAVVGSSAGGFLAFMSGLLSVKPCCIVSFYGYADISSDWAIRASNYYQKDILISELQAEGVIIDQVISQSNEDRYLYYLYCRQSGSWISQISAFNTLIQKNRIKNISPYYNLDENFPRTLLIHGENDQDVPVEESIKMAVRLSEKKVENEVIIIKKMGHEFEKNMKDEELKEIHNKVIDFIDASF